MKNPLRYFPSLFFIVLFFNCSKPCELAREYRVQLDWQFTTTHIRHEWPWTSYTNTMLRQAIDSVIRVQLFDAGEIRVVDSLPDYILRIDSVFADSAIVRERIEDPCQPEQTAWQIFLHGDQTTYSTFDLHQVSLEIWCNLLNAQTGIGKRFTCKMYSGEYTEQYPSQDTVNCNAYHVTGSYSKETVLYNAGIGIHHDVKSQLCKWTMQ